MCDWTRSQPRFIVVARGDQLPFLTYVNLDSEKYIKTFPGFDSFITGNYSTVADFETFVVFERHAHSVISPHGCGRGLLMHERKFPAYMTGHSPLPLAGRR